MDQQVKPVPSKSRSKGKKRKAAAASGKAVASKYQGPIEFKSQINGMPATSNAPNTVNQKKAPADKRRSQASDSDSALSSELSERSDAPPMPKAQNNKVIKNNQKNAINESNISRTNTQYKRDVKTEEEKKVEA